jgi:alpha-tubulin suppressor-like RCC1 family protein
VYAWGHNDNGQVGNRRYGNFLFKPIKVRGFNDEKVVMISCGLGHSVALTESGHVFSGVVMIADYWVTIILMM